MNGNMNVNTATGAQGTLAYQLEAGDLLSQIGVTGTATFAAGSILAFDTSLATPTQATYDLLTATTITDNGITKNFPAGWDYHIIAGGNGQILVGDGQLVGQRNEIGPRTYGRSMFPSTLPSVMQQMNAAERERGLNPRDSIVEAAKKMTRLGKESYQPNAAAHEVYNRLFAEYVTLHDYFGRGENDVMKRLKQLKGDVIRSRE